MRSQIVPAMLQDCVDVVQLRRATFDEPMICMYCLSTRAKSDPFRLANQLQRYVFNGMSLDVMLREGSLEDIVDDPRLPRPHSWGNLDLPAARGYRIRHPDGRSAIVAGFGQSKLSFERASSLVVGVAGAVLGIGPPISNMFPDDSLVAIMAVLQQQLRANIISSVPVALKASHPSVACAPHPCPSHNPTPPPPAYPPAPHTSTYATSVSLAPTANLGGGKSSPSEGSINADVRKLSIVENGGDLKGDRATPHGAGAHSGVNAVLMQDMCERKAHQAPSAAASMLWEIGPWVPSKLELERYLRTFRQELSPKPSGQNMNSMTAAKVREVLDQSGLPRENKSRIWRLSDMDHNGQLDAVEFVCAMVLTARNLKGMLLPSSMPPELKQAVEEATAEKEDSWSEESSDEEHDAPSLPDDSECPPHVQIPEPKWRAEAHLPDSRWRAETQDFLANTELKIGQRDVWLPVMCVRWSHDGINGNMKFKDGRDIFRDLTYSFWKRRLRYSEAVPPMEVILDSEGNLWALGNRRLAAFRMLQALTSETVWLRCWILGPWEYKFKRSKTTQNCGTGVKPNW